ncbi:glycosyltransferase 87 family protein [Actinosynnema sp. CA-299493]
MTRTDVPEHTATTTRPSAGIVVAALALAAAVTVVLVAAIARPDPLWLIGPDFRVYHVAGSAVLDGISPYDVATVEGYPFTYPPFGAVVLAVLGLASVPVAFAGWTFVNVLALETAIWLALGLVAPRSRDRRATFALLAAAAALPLAPVMLNFAVGQINILLLLLLVADLTRRTGRFQGVAIGIAAGIKLLPLIFIAYLLFTRRARAAAVASGTFAATVLVGFLVLPGPSARWAGGLVVDIGRMMTPGAAPFNQSIRGVLAHLPGVLNAQWFWLVLAVPIGAVGLGVAAWASRRGQEAVGVFTCALTGLLVSPVSWPFHWVWAAPGLAVWVWWAWRRNAAHVAGAALTWLVLAASGVLTFLIAVIAPTQTSAGVVTAGMLTTVVVLNSLTVVAGIVFLAALAVALRRGERPPGPLTSPS